MKILLATNNYPRSPQTMAAFCIRAKALALKRQGAEVWVLAPARREPQQPEAGLSVRRFPWSGQSRQDLLSLRLTSPVDLGHASSLLIAGRRALMETCRELQPDICLAAWALPSGYYAMHVHRRLGLPYAVWCLGSDIHTYAQKPLLRGLTRSVLRRAGLRYADGFELAREVEELSGEPCGFLPTGRPLGSNGAASTGMNPQRINFLYVGRWERSKGLDLLLAAWRLLASQTHTERAVLHIAGSGEGLGELVNRMSADPAMAGSINVVGWVSEEALPAMYRTADCVVIPSRSRSESIPVVFSEALDAGTPLLVSDVGDMGQLVRRYKLGRVVKPESVHELSESLAQFIHSGYTLDPDRLTAARKLFDVDDAARRFIADARSLIGS